MSHDSVALPFMDMCVETPDTYGRRIAKAMAPSLPGRLIGVVLHEQVQGTVSGLATQAALYCTGNRST